MKKSNFGYFLLFSVSILVFSILLVAGCAGPSVTMTKIGDATISVSINPDPPKVGENTLIIELAGADGKAIRDAKLKVTALMPAMPSMGMPEMRGEGDVALKGDQYAARVRLSMDGNWTLMVRLESAKLTGNVEYALTIGSKGLSLKESSFGGEQTEMKEERSGGVRISAQKQQLIGVKTETAQRINLVKKIMTVGKIAYDPDLYNAQNEYLQSVAADSEDLIESARTRLRLLGMSDEQISELTLEAGEDRGLILPEKSVWLYARIYEYDLPLVRVGQTVKVTAVSLPGEIFVGRVASINPVLDPETRTATVRAAIDNAERQLFPQMFVNAEINADLGRRLAVSRDAVLDSGIRQVIFVDRGNGYFEPRQVKTGARADSSVEILSGIAEGEKVVTSGNFLIDSESRLKSAFEGMEHQH